MQAIVNFKNTSVEVNPSKLNYHGLTTDGFGFHLKPTKEPYTEPQIAYAICKLERVWRKAEHKTAR